MGDIDKKSTKLSSKFSSLGSEHKSVENVHRRDQNSAHRQYVYTDDVLRKKGRHFSNKYAFQ